MRGAAVHTGGKSPLLQSCRNGLLGLFTFHVLLLCNRRMDRKTLMKSINYSRSILLTVSVLFSQLCTFTTHLLTLQVQRGNISPACLYFCSCYGEDLENIIHFFGPTVFHICCNTTLCIYSVSPSLMRSTGSGNATVWVCFCSASYLFRVYFSTGGEMKQKCKGELQRTCSTAEFCWLGLT